MVQSNNKIAVLSLSGGMDSTSLMLHLIRQGYEVYAVSFNYGQKHSIELERAKKNIEYLATKGYVVKHKIVDLTSAMSDFKSSLTSKDVETPEGFYAEENMKATVVPNRNAIFSSIIYGQALSLSTELNKDAVIALGIHAGDHCFSRDTKILTPNGIMNFEDLKIGDKVYSYNFETNKLEEDTLTAIHKKNVVQQINRITTSAGDIKLTDEHNVFRVKLSNFHPIHGYDKTFEKVKVKDLKIGDYMISPINTEVLKPTLDLSGYDLEQNGEMLDLLPIVDSITLTDTQAKVIPIESEMICLNNEIKFNCILSIKKEEYNDNVFDITIENNHNFFAGEFGQILISNSIYPDCRQEFRDAIAHAFTIGNWGSERISYEAPYLNGDKYDILKDALVSCEVLGLDFDTIMANTNTSYSPNEKGEASGKTGADVERILAFHKLGRKDPVPYVDGWDKALEYALNAEKNYYNK